MDAVTEQRPELAQRPAKRKRKKPFDPLDLAKLPNTMSKAKAALVLNTTAEFFQELVDTGRGPRPMAWPGKYARYSKLSILKILETDGRFQ
jgi:hypothetical protein